MTKITAVVSKNRSGCRITRHFLAASTAWPQVGRGCGVTDRAGNIVPSFHMPHNGSKPSGFSDRCVFERFVAKHETLNGGNAPTIASESTQQIKSQESCFCRITARVDASRRSGPARATPDRLAVSPTAPLALSYIDRTMGCADEISLARVYSVSSFRTYARRTGAS